MAGTSLHDDRAANKDKNYNQEIILPSAPLLAVKPATKHTTIIRIIPQTDGNGNAIPMVTGADEHGFLFSNLHRESIAFGVGLQTRFTGSVDAADARGLSDPDMPFAGLYITLKGKVNKNALTQQEFGPVMQLLTKPANGAAPLSQVQKVACIQAYVFTDNDKPVNPPRLACVFLGASGVQALQACLTQAANNKVDVFDPKAGFTLKIFGIPQGARPPLLGVELLQPMPMPDELWRGKFLPWDQVIKRHTYDDLIRKMVTCYGAGVVGMRSSFAEAMQRLGIAIPQLGMPQQQPQQYAQQGQPQGQQYAQQGQPQAQQWTPQPQQPAPGGWPAQSQPVAQPAAQPQQTWQAPAAAAPAAGPQWGQPGTATPAAQPQQPAQQSPPNWGQTAASAPAPVVTPPVTAAPAQASTPADLAARYQAELAKLTPPAGAPPA